MGKQKKEKLKNIDFEVTPEMIKIQRKIMKEQQENWDKSKDERFTI